MGLLGGALLLGGIGAVIIGVIGVIVGLMTWQFSDAGLSALILLGGLVSGAIATSILE
jgi:hypothetical protein